MGYMTGFLKGFQGRRDETYARQLEQDQARRQAEAKIYESLLQSKDAEIKRLALAGLFESALPGARKKGLSGFLGEVEGGTIYPMLKARMDEYVLDEPPESVGGGPTPPVPGSAAMPQDAPVTPGSAPIQVGPPPTVGTPPSTEAQEMGMDLPALGQAVGGTPPGVGPQAGPQVGPVGMPPPMASPVAQFKRRGTGVPTTHEIGAEQHRQRQEQILLQGVAEEQGLLAMRDQAIQAGRLDDLADINAWIAINQQRKGGGYQWKTYMDAQGNPQVYRVDPRTGEMLPEAGLSPLPTARNSVAMNDAARILGARNGQGYQSLQDIPRGHPDNEKAAEIAIQLAGQRSFTTGYQGQLGGARGRFEGPIDLRTAQDTGTTPGLPQSAYSRQFIPAASTQDRIRTIHSVRGELQNIRTLLSILPSTHELGAVAPGLVASYKSLGFQDEAAYYAALEAAIENVVGSVSNAIQENKGQVTQQDINRAYTAVTQLKSHWLGGDTQEMALARIGETLGRLDRAEELLTQPVLSVPGATTTPPPPSTGNTDWLKTLRPITPATAPRMPGRPRVTEVAPSPAR